MKYYIEPGGYRYTSLPILVYARSEKPTGRNGDHPSFGGGRGVHQDEQIIYTTAVRNAHPAHPVYFRDYLLLFLLSVTLGFSELHFYTYVWPEIRMCCVCLCVLSPTPHFLKHIFTPRKVYFMGMLYARPSYTYI